MVRSKTLAVYAAIIVAGLVAGYGLHALLAPSNMPWQAQGLAVVKLEVYKNGQLVYEKTDDPATDNLLQILKELSGTGGSFTDTSGTTWNSFETTTTGSRVAVSDGTGVAFSRSMYVLPGTVYRSSNPVTVTVNDGTIIFSGTVTLTTTTNITWVGLELGLDVATSDSTTSLKWFLVFADEVNPPIQVNANDVVTVVYKIVWP